MEETIKKLSELAEGKIKLREKEILKLINELTRKSEIIHFDELYIKIMKKTNSILIINSLALIMEEFPDYRYREVLFEVFKKRKKGERGTIFFAMTAYDYGSNINEIINILLNDGISDEESMSFSDVLENMKSLNIEEINGLLSYYLSYEPTENKKKMVINTVIRSLNEHKVSKLSGSGGFSNTYILNE
jgi:hypothetical protein